MSKYIATRIDKGGYTSVEICGPHGDCADVTRFSDGSFSIFVGRTVQYEGGSSTECDDETDAMELAATVTEAIRSLAAIPNAPR